MLPRRWSIARPDACWRTRSNSGCSTRSWTPECSVRPAAQTDLDSASNRALAREMAEARSCCSTPAPRSRCSVRTGRRCSRIAVVGPCADDPRTLMGCYSFPNHVAPRHPGTGLGLSVPTPLEALRAELPGVEITYEPGCAVVGDDRAGFAAAIDSARRADLCIALVGDIAGLFGQGTSGEGCDVEDLRLPGVQADLIAELLDAGTPVVVVVVSGRPYALGDIAPRAAGTDPGVHARRGGRPRPSPGSCPDGCSRAASCRYRSRGTPAPSRPPTCSHHWAGLRAPASRA